jgi:lysine-N-methylase
MQPCCQERRLSQTKLIRPDYAESFRCIGSACEDTCCKGWCVPLDEAACEKYRALPPSPMRTLIDASIQVNGPAADGAKPASFAKIRMTESNQCPMLAKNGLCGIQTAYGEGYLSHTCATYPRILRSVGEIEEKALTLSCPEAARFVLLSPKLVNLRPQAAPVEMAGQPAEVETAPDSRLLQSQYWPIRAAVLDLIQNRVYPLWQRLFLLGVFCRRLDSIASGELRRSVPDFLRDFAATVATGALRPAMETLPIDRAAQLDVVLRLAGLLLHRSNIRPRFIECIQAFTAGIGNGPGATLESLTAHYAVAYDRHYAPFFERHPQILENYLINTVVRCQFPFGCDGLKPEAAPSLAREYALLTAQFALMKGLLIGVAGHYREDFSATHVVHTVQAASKHFEHHPEFLNQTHALLVESQMDGARGLAILLRNAEPAASQPASPTIHAPGPQTEVRAS